jgi:hypothetical protein
MIAIYFEPSRAVLYIIFVVRPTHCQLSLLGIQHEYGGTTHRMLKSAFFSPYHFTQACHYHYLHRPVPIQLSLGKAVRCKSR